MSRKRKSLPLLLCLLITTCGVPSWMAWHESQRVQNSRLLIKALLHKDTPLALTALQRGVDPNCRATETAPAPSIWELLLERWQHTCTRMPLRTHIGPSALSLAVQNNSTSVVQTLVAAGARDIGEAMPSPNRRTYAQNSSLLMIAVWYQNAAMVQALLHSGSNIHAVDEAHQTALFYCEDTVTAQVLIAGGIDLNATDNHGQTALDYGLQDIDWNNASFTPLCLLLIDRGAQDALAMTTAAERGYQDILRAMLDAGHDPNVWDKEGQSPLMVALTSNHPRCIRLLLDRGADVTARSSDGSTPLHTMAERYAASRATWYEADEVKAGGPIFLKKFLALGASIDAQDHNGYTPLMRAARALSPSMVRLLLQHGANRNKRSNDGQTALDLMQHHPFEMDKNNFAPDPNREQQLPEVIRLLKNVPLP